MKWRRHGEGSLCEKGSGRLGEADISRSRGCRRNPSAAALGDARCTPSTRGGYVYTNTHTKILKY